jgi:hypothetical protein
MLTSWHALLTHSNGSGGVLETLSSLRSMPGAQQQPTEEVQHSCATTDFITILLLFLTWVD